MVFLPGSGSRLPISNAPQRDGSVAAKPRSRSFLCEGGRCHNNGKMYRDVMRREASGVGLDAEVSCGRDSEGDKAAMYQHAVSGAAVVALLLWASPLAAQPNEAASAPSPSRELRITVQTPPKSINNDNLERFK
jgi:hypothetical protein